MRPTLNRLTSVARPWLNNAPRYALVGAWFFAIVSAIPLIWLMIEGHGGDGSSRVFGATVNGVVHTVWGLTYAGFFGSLLLWLEFFALIAATLMAALPANFKFTGPELTGRMRHIGLGYLTGWAGLWMLGTMYLAAVDPGFWIVQALFIAALFACTVYRALHEWSSASPTTPSDAGESQAAPAIDAIGNSSPSSHTDMADISRFMLHRSAVRHSDRVREHDLEEGLPPQRRFAPENSTPRTSLDDDYGAALRLTVKRTARFLGQGVSSGVNWIKRSAKAAAAVLANASRSTRSA
jgi:hypothetical protein